MTAGPLRPHIALRALALLMLGVVTLGACATSTADTATDAPAASATGGAENTDDPTPPGTAAGKTPANPAGPELDEAAYQAAANAACQREIDTLADLAAPDLNSNASVQAWFDRTIPAARALAEEIAALTPPSALAADHAELVTALSDRVTAATEVEQAAAAATPEDLYSAVAAASAPIDDAEDRAGDAEYRLGLDVCLG